MKTLTVLFLVSLALAVAWSLGYRTGSLDTSSFAYADGYNDGLLGIRQ